MSEKLYQLLLKLYPDHFRRRYGDEALRLVRDRARNEKGFLSGLRLWMDLLLDLATSLPREYSSAPAAAAPQPLNGAPLFQLLDERRLKPSLLYLGGAVSALLFWACNYAVVHSRTFPVLIRAPLSLQGPGQSTPDQVRYPSQEGSPLPLRAGKLTLAQAGRAHVDLTQVPTRTELAQDTAAVVDTGGAVGADKHLAFGVISIRRHTAESGPSQAGLTADGFRSIGLPMAGIFQRAYALPNQSGVVRGDLIRGAPGWLSGELYDVEAKVGGADLADWQKPGMRQAMLRAMLRTMLAERCGAVVHFGNNAAPELVIDHVEQPYEN